MSEAGECENLDRGGPAIQWSRAIDDGKIRAVQIGIVSRGLGCSVHSGRPGIYTKVGIRKSWIMDNIIDGGCSSFV